jgi:hypothetical protein
MNYNQKCKLTGIILIAIIVLASSLLIIKSISDGDFFWHLKAGEWLWQNKSLPSEDIFAHTSPEAQTMWAHFIITSYWLSQLIYFLFHLAGGMSGIVFLRFIIALSLIYMMLKRHHGDFILYLSLLMIFMVTLLTLYPLERPHVFSFLCFSVLLYLLEQLKNEKNSSQGKTACFLLPFTMLIWANMHAGYIVGLGTILIFILFEGLKFIHPSLMPLQKKTYKNFLIVGTLGIAVSFINPNFYDAITVMFSQETSYASTSNLEYQSPLWTFKQYNDYRILPYFFILLLAVIGMIINLRKINITEIVLLAGIGYFSFTAIRYIPFFMIAALPITGRYLSKVNHLKLYRVLICAIALYATVFFTWKERLNIELITSGKWVNTYEYPVAATEFILQNNIKGNMYNNLEWGGYLMWRLGPERKVFIDGRVLFEDIFKVSKLVLRAHNNGVSGEPYWKHTLNKYGVTYAIIPLILPSGEFPQIVIALIEDNEWKPVFLESNTLIFLKNSPENNTVLKKFSIPNNYFVMSLINHFTRIVQFRPYFVQAHLAISDLYTSIGRYNEARDSYIKVLQIAPYNTKAMKMLKLFNMMLKK